MRTSVLVVFGLTGEPAIGLRNITGRGGFMPFGASGVWLGTCFVIYSFIGVEIVGVTSGVASELRREIPVPADDPPEHLGQIADQVVQVQIARLHRLLAAEREQLACEIGRLF